MSEVPAATGAVRDRLAALVAEVLPALDPVPPRLRRIADFAPARRARLGGEQILTVLEADDALRARAAPLVRERHEGAGADTGGSDDPDLVESAALAWLLRGPGWEEAWARAVEALAARSARESAGREEQDVVRLTERAQRAEAALSELRAERKRQTEELRAEVADLRRRLGETRVREREARRTAEAVGTDLEAVRREARDSVGEGEAERRRLRARVEELGLANAALRRHSRQDRDDAGLRVRVLLDSVVEAAAGLRRELVLPVADGSPADRVEQRIAERSVDAGTTAGRDSPAALEQYLAAPRARLLVDGYNVSKTAWPETSLEAQRVRLLRSLAPVVARTGAETTVVFDGAGSTARPMTTAPRGVRVLFSPYGVIADDVIAELVEAEPAGRTVVVVSSDREVAAHATRYGARALAATSLLAVLS